MAAKLKDEKDLERLKISGRILVKILGELAQKAKPGVRLRDLDDWAKNRLAEMGARSAFFGYQPSGADQPYPAQICTSLNEIIVHGLPNNSTLKEGDVLKIDFGVDYQGYITDAALTVGVGRISPEAEKLIKTTKAALFSALSFVKAGNRLGDIGWVIEDTVKRSGFSVAQGLTGHGVGFDLHEDPIIYNFGQKGTGPVLKKGMVLAIEPMVVIGSGQIRKEADDSYASAENGVSAHFEKTVFVADDGFIDLTPW